MRRSWIAIAAGTALLAAAATSLTAPATAATAHTAHLTVRTVVRPVTSSGHAAPGYRVDTSKDADPIDCSYPASSLAAVDPGILRCAPDAAGADACWRAATPHHVLCLRDATGDVLVKLRKTSGPIAHPSTPKHREPLELKLANGLVCDLRDGGAGTFLRQHHSWSAFYYCNHDQAVWAPLNARSGVRHHHNRVWTVEVAKSNGKQHVHAVRVKRAYLVGTLG